MTVACNKGRKPTKEDIQAMKITGHQGEADAAGNLKPAQTRVRKTKEGTGD